MKGSQSAILRRGMWFIALLFNVGVWVAFMNVLSSRDELQHRIDSYQATQCTVTTQNARVQELSAPNKTTKYRALIRVLYNDQYGKQYQTELYDSGGNDSADAGYSASFPSAFVMRFQGAKDKTFQCFYDPAAPETLLLYLPR